MRAQPALCLFLLLLPATLGSAAAQTAPPVIVPQELLQTGHAWDGSFWAYPATPPQITLQRLRIPPDTTLGWHRHPMLNVAYVERGAITVERRHDGGRRHFIAGSAIPEMMNVPHRGHTGADGADLLIFYAGTPGMPLSIPVP
ncbi:cupin domain-containing protein [Stenotrophomonas sp. LGBM10]|uniref:cupin domain-containing protein n=1 Tax=Stenotrophomonas sp. LGBM10 TaxID=3390038 RepID=UPI00398B907C